MNFRIFLFWILVICVLSVTSYSEQVFVRSGLASWYGTAHHGKKTASGERFDMKGFTAAHRTLEFGTIVEVLNVDNGLRVVVVINDRGPYIDGRIIDLSKSAAAQLGCMRKGICRVKLEIVEDR